MILEVRIPRNQNGSTFVMAAGKARRIADAGDVALVYETGDRRKSFAAYVRRNPDGTYDVVPATLLEPSWINSLRRIIVSVPDE